MEKIDNNIQLAFLGGMKAGLEALIHGLEVVAENNNGQVSFEFVKMVSSSTIADVELKLSSMENGKGLIDALNIEPLITKVTRFLFQRDCSHILMYI